MQNAEGKRCGEDGAEMEGEEGRDGQKDGYLLRHHLFDLRFHIPIHSFSFKTRTRGDSR